MGVSRLRVMWSEARMRSSMVVPLWSVVWENHRGEWAFTSPAMMWFGKVCRWLKRLVMSLSSCRWWGLLVSLGGMYRLVMWYCLLVLRCSRRVCVSMFGLMRVVGGGSSVKVRECLMYVSSPPPFFWSRSDRIHEY